MIVELNGASDWWESQNEGIRTHKRTKKIANWKSEKKTFENGWVPILISLSQWYT